MSDDAGSLGDRVRGFASELTSLVRAVIGVETPEFVAVASPIRLGDKTRLVVRTDGGVEIPLTVDGQDALRLTAQFTCDWDHQESYLAVRKSSISVLSVDVSEPLFRYEFDDAMSRGSLPSAHIHVHAHRDEIVYGLFRGQSAKARSRRQKVEDNQGGRLPHLSSVHFAVGGPRFRPVLEDVLQMLIEEFGVDALDGAQDAINERRAQWRRHQAGAVVRDSPDVAVRVLREMGYDVTWSHDEPPPLERSRRLTSP